MTADNFSNLNVLQQNFRCRKKETLQLSNATNFSSIRQETTKLQEFKVERFADKFVTDTMRKDPVQRHKRLDFPRWQRFICIYTDMWPAVISLAHAWRCKDHRSNGRDLNFYLLTMAQHTWALRTPAEVCFSTKYQLGFPSLYHLMKARGTQPKRRGK